MTTDNSGSTPRIYEDSRDLLIAAMREKIDQGNSFEAITMAKSWLHSNHPRKSVVSELIRAYEECGFKEDAERVRERKRKLWPKQHDPALLAEPPKEEKDLSFAARADQRHILALLYQPASEATTNMIINLSKEFIRKHGETIEILAGMRDACMNIDRFDEATIYAERISSFAPGDMINNRKVAIADALTGHHKRGIERLYEMIKDKYDPGTILVLKDLAQASIETRRYRALLQEGSLRSEKRIKKYQIDDSIPELPADAPDYIGTVTGVLRESVKRHRRIDSQAHHSAGAASGASI